MEDFKNRLTEYARTRFDMGQNRFEDYCEINRGTINAIKVQGPTASIVTKIALKCPDLNLNWLFRGEGPMTVSEISNTASPAVSIGTIQTVNIGNWGELVELLKTKVQ